MCCNLELCLFFVEEARSRDKRVLCKSHPHLRGPLLTQTWLNIECRCFSPSPSPLFSTFMRPLTQSLGFNPSLITSQNLSFMSFNNVGRVPTLHQKLPYMSHCFDFINLKLFPHYYSNSFQLLTFQRRILYFKLISSSNLTKFGRNSSRIFAD